MNPLDARRRLLGRNVYKRTTEGNPAIAQGSLARRYPGITMQGWTEQDSYEGNQLFDKSGIVLSGTTITYTPVNVGDGEFTLSTDYIAIGRNDIFFLPGNVNTGASSLSNGVELGTSRTVTSENGYVTVALRLSLDGTTSPLDYHIMLNAGSAALPYEPYTGEQPSPNPDYPQEITSAGKYDEGTGKYQYEVKLTGANLFNPDAEYVEGTYLGLPLHNNGRVSLILYEKNPDIDISAINFGFTVTGYDASKGANWAIISGEYAGGAITNVIDDAYLSVYPKDKLDTVLERYDVMVNYGTEPLPYQPYKEQTVTLTSDRPLTKWDKLEKRGGQWGWVYKSAEVVFDGDTSEGWILYNTLTDVNVFYIDISDTLDKANSMEIFCNKMENVRNGYNVDRPYIIYGHNNYGNVYANVKSTDASNVSGFKTWLSENPLTVLFETSTETFVPLTASEQEQMNALYTCRPTTVLSNQQDCEMALTYKTRKSMEVTT